MILHAKRKGDRTEILWDICLVGYKRGIDVIEYKTLQNRNNTHSKYNKDIGLT